MLAVSRYLRCSGRFGRSQCWSMMVKLFVPLPGVMAGFSRLCYPARSTWLVVVFLLIRFKGFQESSRRRIRFRICVSGSNSGGAMIRTGCGKAVLSPFSPTWYALPYGRKFTNAPIYLFQNPGRTNCLLKVWEFHTIRSSPRGLRCY